MITAIVLIRTARGRTQAAAEALLEIDGVNEVYSVTGEYDLVAIVRLAQYDDLAEVVTERMIAIEGITRTQTMMAFKAYSRADLERTETLMAFECYSRRDLERMWTIGTE